MSQAIAPLLIIMAMVGAMTCADSTTRSGFYLFPRSTSEAKGIVLRGFQLLFIVSLVLPAYHVSQETVNALTTSSLLGMVLCGFAFWRSNRAQAVYGFSLILLALVIGLLFPAVSA